MFDVISIGSATLDVFFQSSQFQLVQKDGGVSLCEKFNEKIDVEKAAISSGGAATNTAVGFARLGFRAGCIAKIGQDTAGQIVLQELKREGVDVDMVATVSGEDTSLSGLLISQDGARTALVHRGASNMLTAEDVQWEKLEAQWIHLSSVGNAELISRIFEHCKLHQIKLSWNPGNWEIDQIKSGSLRPDWSAVEILFTNRDEMTQLSGTNLADDETWKSSWCFVGPRMSITTDGKNGGRYCVDGQCQWYAGKPTQVVQETGAGDAFAVGVIGSLIMNTSIEQSIENGRNNASSVVGYFGAKTGLLRKENLFA